MTACLMSIGGTTSKRTQDWLDFHGGREVQCSTIHICPRILAPPRSHQNAETTLPTPEA